MVGKFQLVLWVAVFLVSCVFFKLMGESVYVAVSLAVIGSTVNSVICGILKLCREGEEW